MDWKRAGITEEMQVNKMLVSGRVLYKSFVHSDEKNSAQSKRVRRQLRDNWNKL